MVAQYLSATGYGEKVTLGIKQRLDLMDSAKPIPSLVLQEWETGRVELESMVQVETTMQRVPGQASTCGWDDLCFCGGELICKLDGDWQEAPMKPTIPAPYRRL